MLWRTGGGEGSQRKERVGRQAGGCRAGGSGTCARGWAHKGVTIVDIVARRERVVEWLDHLATRANAGLFGSVCGAVKGLRQGTIAHGGVAASLGVNTTGGSLF